MWTQLTNIGLLFSFLTLAVSGVLSFIQPFSLVVTRVHIVFGVLTLILIGFHLWKKLGYFQRSIQKKLGLWLMAGVVWLFFVYVSIANISPAPEIIAQSYEAKHRKEIVRPAAVVASMLDNKQLISSRIKKESDQTALSVHVAFNQELKELPAIAIWAETKAGSMIETLYISPELAYSDRPTWKGQTLSRHKVLPVWRHRYTTLTGVDPEGKIDAASGATENHSFSLETYLNVGDNAYIIFCEINAAYDPDDKWPDENLGQPSVLYSAYVEHQEDHKYQLLELTGHGGNADKSGAIHYDLEKISTAKQLIDLVLVFSRAIPSKD